MPTIYSFSKKRGPRPPPNAVVIDARSIQNPHHDKNLRKLNGTHKTIQELVLDTTTGPLLLLQGMEAFREGHDVAYMCFGGKHRSVALATILARTTGTQAIHLNEESWA
jgi:RNase adaptor protein for sRNA GlmZ degradation